MLAGATGKKISAEDAERQSTQKASREDANDVGEHGKLNHLTHDIIAAAIAVHKELGPGLLESACEACLTRELELRGHRVRTQVALPVSYKGMGVDLGYRLDMVVDDLIIVELKTVEGVLPIHRAQLTSYLRLSGKKVGLLINFHSVRLVDGITRIVNQS